MPGALGWPAVFVAACACWFGGAGVRGAGTAATVSASQKFFGTAKPQKLLLKDTETELYDYTVLGTDGAAITTWWITSPPGNARFNETRMRFCERSTDRPTPATGTIE